MAAPCCCSRTPGGAATLPPLDSPTAPPHHDPRSAYEPAHRGFSAWRSALQMGVGLVAQRPQLARAPPLLAQRGAEQRASKARVRIPPLCRRGDGASLRRQLARGSHTAAHAAVPAGEQQPVIVLVPAVHLATCIRAAKSAVSSSSSRASSSASSGDRGRAHAAVPGTRSPRSCQRW